MVRSRELDHPIASGRTADVYPWGEGTVIKLFHRRIPFSDVLVEQRYASAAYSAGIRTPAVHGIVRHRRRNGLVFDRVDGPTLMQEIWAKPEAMDEWARLLADLHVDLHRHRGAPGLPQQRERLTDKIAGCRLLSRHERDAVLDAIARLPDGDSFCHGDFHPANVMLTENGPVIIDWIDAFSGNPIADIARTSILILGHIEVELVDPTARTAVERFHEVYLQQCMAATPELRAEYEQWLPVVAAARLTERTAEQRDWLLARVRTGLDIT